MLKEPYTVLEVLNSLPQTKYLYSHVTVFFFFFSNVTVLITAFVLFFVFALAELGLSCSPQALSSCGTEVHGLLTAVASLISKLRF